MALFLFFSLTFSLGFTLLCPDYSCGSGMSTENDCSLFSLSSGVPSYLITPCEQGLLCEFSSDTNSTCSIPLPHSRYPGDYCSSNTDCISNQCISHTCIGSPVNSPCSTSTDCNFGLYCSENSLCSLQQSGLCNSTLQCLNSEICNNGTCILMFSLEIGNKTDVLIEQGLCPCMFNWICRRYRTWTGMCRRTYKWNYRVQGLWVKWRL